MPYNLAFVAAWLTLLLAWETAAPARHAGPRWRRFGFHLSLTVLNSVLYEAFLGGETARVLGPAGSIVRALFTIVALDLALYWLHRANHSRWLWRFHQVHHSDTQLDLSTAFREHPGQTLISSALMLLPLYWLRPSPMEYAIYSAALAAFSSIPPPTSPMPSPPTLRPMPLCASLPGSVWPVNSARGSH